MTSVTDRLSNENLSEGYFLAIFKLKFKETGPQKIKNQEVVAHSLLASQSLPFSRSQALGHGVMLQDPCMPISLLSTIRAGG